MRHAKSLTLRGESFNRNPFLAGALLVNNDKDISRRWQLLAITAVIVYLIWLLAPVLMPFAVAAMLAYLGDPLVDRLERLGLNRMRSEEHPSELQSLMRHS